MQRKTILVTGARQGIGRYLVEQYSAQGHQVIGMSRRPSEFEAEGYEHLCTDVADDRQVRQAFKTLRKRYGRLDVLVNNAAINPSIAPFVLVPADTIKDVYSTNVFGSMNTCREGIKLMMKHGHGRIINVSSMAVRHEVAGESVYTSSKAAITAFTRVLAKEVHKYGITCNVLAPSAVPTELSSKVDQAALRAVLARNAIEGFGEMADISGAIDWLMRDESNAITGQVIYLGGA